MSADIYATLLDAQSRRIDRLWTKFEQTGEDRWMHAAMEADRLYLRMRELVRA